MVNRAKNVGTLAYSVSAKIRRSLKTAIIIGILACGAFFYARPFIALVEPTPPLDNHPITYADFEAEHHAYAESAESDSVIDERSRLPIEKTFQVNYGSTFKDVLINAGLAIEALRVLE